MSLSVSPLFSPFAMPVAVQTHQSAVEQRPSDDGHPRRQRQPHARTSAPAESIEPSEDPGAPLPVGTLIDVQA